MSALEQTLEQFVEDLAARKPTPGGGAVAAYSGALAAALGRMVAAYTSGDKYSDVEEDAARIGLTIDGLGETLRGYVDDDIAAYGGFVEAKKLPKDTDEQKAARKEAMQEAMWQAAAVPLQTMKACMTLMEQLEDLAAICNPNVITDLGTALLNAHAGLRGAQYNVEINLKYLEDHEMHQAAHSEFQTTSKRAEEVLERALRKVEERM